MKKNIVPILLLGLLGAVPGAAQNKLAINGYFSFQAIRGGGGLPSTAWSLGNVWGGLIFSGEPAKGVTFALEPTFAPGESIDLTQAWAGLAINEGMAIKAGLFLVPFGKYNLARRPYETPWVSDPYPIGFSFPVNWREVGLAAQASISGFNVALFVGNGLAEGENPASGQQFRDNNRNKAWGGRVGLALGSSLEVGGSYYRGKADANNSRSIKMLGADLTWLTENLKAGGEYVRAEIENPSPFGKGVSEGWFGEVQIRYGNWIPAISYQHQRTDDPFHGPGFAGPDVPGSGLSLDGTRWAFGAAYKIGANILLKLEYDRERERGESAWRSAVRVQAALYF